MNNPINVDEEEWNNRINLAAAYHLADYFGLSDIMDIQIGSTTKIEGDKPEQLIQRILTASSFKLNWVLDPFARTGGIGVITKKMGRRFIGFEGKHKSIKK